MAWTKLAGVAMMSERHVSQSKLLAGVNGGSTQQSALNGLLGKDTKLKVKEEILRQNYSALM